MKFVITIVSIWLCGFVASELNTKEEYEAYKASHPQEFSGKYEGDILRSSFRNNAANARKWTNGIVPYDDSAMGEFAKLRIRKALDILQEKVGSCIQFKKRTTEYNYVQIISDTGCYSYVGMQLYSGQKLSLKESGCLGDETIQHEFIHALGFHHEQCRSDRDDYIKINWENVPQKWHYAFQKEKTNNQGLPYEYTSVMQYGKYAFSNNGKPSMTPLRDGAELANRNNLHERDVKMIQKLYGCKIDGSNGNGGSGNGGSGNGGSGNGGSGNNETCHMALPQPGRQQAGEGLKTTSASTIDDCSALCNNEPQCTGATWKPNTCWMHKKKKTLVKNDELTYVDKICSECKNLHESCDSWLKYCYNSKYVTYMRKNCMKTCGLCGGGSR